MTAALATPNVVARLDSMSRLGRLVRDRLAELGTGDQPLSYRAAAERSRSMVSHELIRQIANNKHTGRITDTTAEGLATALELPVSLIYLAAETPRPLSKWVWPERFDHLDESERRAVESFAAAILNAREKGRQEALDRMRKR